MTSQTHKVTKSHHNKESLAGIMLFFAACIAIVCANTSFRGLYTAFINTPVSVQIASFTLAKPLLLWINDGLMVIFFLLVGLELKREFLLGELASPDKIKLPVIGAVGGMVIPALIYVALNWTNSEAIKGWAIPAATDIAFVLGVLSLLGKRVPIALKIFVTTLAVIDDIGAIIIIAAFYSSEIQVGALLFSFACVPVLLLFNWKGVRRHSPYILVGLLMWLAMLKSGVHATITGVLIAFCIPLDHPKDSMLEQLMQELHPVTAYFILPLFAFANSGINLSTVDLNYVTHSIPLGIALGLFIGKQLGIFSTCWLAIRIGITSLPRGVSLSAMYGAAALCGIGFTMSLFIGSLAFDDNTMAAAYDERVGIMIGSLLSGILGYVVLRMCLPLKQKSQ